MLFHGIETDHKVVLSYADLSVWCYGCEHYVHNEVTVKLLLYPLFHTAVFGGYLNNKSCEHVPDKEFDQYLGNNWVKLKRGLKFALEFLNTVKNPLCSCALFSLFFRLPF